MVVDLPGIYSLSPYSAEEVVARDFLMKDKPDVVIDVVDATNLQRNLYLTVQLMEIGVPTVVALNMIDEVKRQGEEDRRTASSRKEWVCPLSPLAQQAGRA